LSSSWAEHNLAVRNLTSFFFALETSLYEVFSSQLADVCQSNELAIAVGQGLTDMPVPTVCLLNRASLTFDFGPGRKGLANGFAEYEMSGAVFSCMSILPFAALITTAFCSVALVSKTNIHTRVLLLLLELRQSFSARKHRQLAWMDVGKEI